MTESRLLLLIVALAVLVPTAVAVADQVSDTDAPGFTCFGIGIADAPTAGSPAEAVEGFVEAKTPESTVAWTRWHDDPRSDGQGALAFRTGDVDEARMEVGLSVLDVSRLSDGSWTVVSGCS